MRARSYFNHKRISDMLAKHEGFFNNRKNNVIKSAAAAGGSVVVTAACSTLCWLSVEHSKSIFPTNRPETFPFELFLTMLAVPISGALALCAFCAAVFFFKMAIEDYYKYKDAMEDAELGRLLANA
jgi:hypothetical protein